MEAKSLRPSLVRAFIGVTGFNDASQNPTWRNLQGSALLNPLTVLRIGSTQVAAVGREGDVGSLPREGSDRLLFTGRPFHRNEPAWEQDLPPHGESLGTLDGKFAGVLIQSETCELFTDFLGAGSVYYAAQGEQAYFASHLGLLLRILPWRPELDDTKVAAQLFARAQIFEETHFAGVFRLPAGKRLVAGSDGIRVADSGASLAGLLNSSAPDYGPDTFWEMLDRGVQRERYGPDSILMYSGGRDSSAIALASSDHPVRSATYGEHYSIDRTQGIRRAKRLGLQAQGVPYDHWTLNSYRSEIVGLHAGCSGLQTTHNMVGFDWAKGLAAVASVGFMGDALTGAHSGDCAPDEHYVLHILLPNHRDSLLSRAYAEEKRVVKEYVLDRFSTLAASVGPRSALMMLDLQWRQARWISMMFDLCDWFMPVSYPFVQRELVASCLQASDDSLMGQRDYDRALSARLQQRGRRVYTPESRLERLKVEVMAGVAARLRGRRIVGRCDWHSVMERTEFDPTILVSGNERLDSLTAESWDSWLASPDARKTNIPVAFASAPIAGARAGGWE